MIHGHSPQAHEAPYLRRKPGNFKGMNRGIADTAKGPRNVKPGHLAVAHLYQKDTPRCSFGQYITLTMSYGAQYGLDLHSGCRPTDAIYINGTHLLNSESTSISPPPILLSVLYTKI